MLCRSASCFVLLLLCEEDTLQGSLLSIRDLRMLLQFVEVCEELFASGGYVVDPFPSVHLLDSDQTQLFKLGEVFLNEIEAKVSEIHYPRLA